MEMKGEYRIQAPRDAVWTALNDIGVLKRCLRGCERLERIDDSRMAGTVTIKVGPVKATFNGEITLSEIDPPNGYRIAGDGKAGPVGYAKGGAKVELSEDGGETVLTYAVDASLGGKLAQIGSRVIDAAAKKLADDFFKKFVGEVTQDASGQAETGRSPDGLWKWWFLAGVAAVALALAFSN